MAQSATCTTALKSATARPRLTLITAKPESLASQKSSQPYDGLLMAPPDSDDDGSEERQSIVDYMFFLTKNEREYQKMLNWRDQPVFVDDEPEMNIKWNDSGIDMADGMKQLQIGEAKEVKVQTAKAKEVEIKEAKAKEIEPAQEEVDFPWDGRRVKWPGVTEVEKTKGGAKSS